jgi:hypothetical protein
MMKQIIKSTILLSVCVALFLTGCGSSSQSNLYGTWERTTPGDQLGWSIFALADRIEFLKDGTFVIPTANNASGTYSFPEDGRIKFEGQYGAAVYKFTLSGDTLIFYDDGKQVEYKRIK